MRNLLFIAMMGIMTGVSIPSWAQWTSVGRDNVKGVFIDLTSIHRAGDTVKIWSLSDFKVEQEIDGEKFLSEKMHHAAHCKEKQITPLAMSVFTENMGNGTVVFSDNIPHRWVSVAPGSFGEIILKIACGNIQAS